MLEIPIFVLEALNQDEWPVHESHILLSDLLSSFLVVESYFLVVVGHTSSGPHNWRTKLVENHLGKA